jgi:hypothetical protein
MQNQGITIEGLHKYSQMDTGMSMTSLRKLSHIPLFGRQSGNNAHFERRLVVSPMAAVLGFSMAAQISLYPIRFLQRLAHPRPQHPLK